MKKYFLLAGIIFLTLSSLASAQTVEGNVETVEKNIEALEENIQGAAGGDAKSGLDVKTKCTIDGKEVPCAEAVPIIRKLLLFMRNMIDAFLDLLRRLLLQSR